MKIANASSTPAALIKDDTPAKPQKSQDQSPASPRSTNATQQAPRAQESRQSSAQNAQSKPRSSAADELGSFAKKANSTIGSLDVMIRSLHSLQAQNRSFEKLALKLQPQAQDEAVSKDSTQANKDLAQKADAIKAKMQAIFDSATFDDENVFAKNYQEILPENKLNPKKLSPSKLSIKQPENLSQYSKDLNEQKHYAKEAKKLLKAALDDRADSVQKTDSSYEKLDRSKLTEPEFKAAQGSSGVTLDRVLHFLR